MSNKPFIPQMENGMKLGTCIGEADSLELIADYDSLAFSLGVTSGDQAVVLRMTEAEAQRLLVGLAQGFHGLAEFRAKAVTA